MTLSLDALFDSFITILSQGDQYSSNRTISGFNTGNDYKKIIATEGQAILFLQKNREMIERIRRPLHLLNDDRWSLSFETYRHLLKYAKKENINVIVFINPYHSDYLEIVRQTGHWKLFTEWKKKIAQTTFGFNNVTLWDFALVNEFTTEQPPPEGTTNTKINWFWEPAHYNKNYGDLILGQILDETDDKGIVSGIKVTNISHYIKMLNKQEFLLKSSNSSHRILQLLIK